MKVSTPRILYLLLTCWLLTGCSQWRYDMGVPISSNNLPAQKTPLNEVLQLLGPPLRMSASDTGFIMAWEHWDIRSGGPSNCRTLFSGVFCAGRLLLEIGTPMS